MCGFIWVECVRAGRRGCVRGRGFSKKNILDERRADFLFAGFADLAATESRARPTPAENRRGPVTCAVHGRGDGGSVGGRDDRTGSTSVHVR